MKIVANGIEFGSEFIREVGEQASDERIAVSRIRACRLAYGPIARRPRLQFAVGAILASGICLAVYFFVAVLLAGRKFWWSLELSLIIFSWVGLWLMRDAFKKAHYIEVCSAGRIFRLRLLGLGDGKSMDEVRRAAAQGSNLSL
jgi:hypothetical protein